MADSAAGLSRRAYFAGLAIAVAWHVWRLIAAGASTETDWDAQNLYQPLARQLLSQGWSFFLDERSLMSPPLPVLLLALEGGSIAAVKTTNAALSVATLLMLARSATLLHSRTAGVATAVLFAASPLMRPFLATAATEPPYFFGCALWLWGFAEWRTSGRATFAWLSAAGLAAATLTRAPIFYWNVLLVIALVVALATRRAGREYRVVLFASIVALLPPLLLTAKNVIVFGFPFFATGGGGALFQGNNPLMGGYDPIYLGLAHDAGAIIRTGHHLDLRGEKMLRDAFHLIVADKGFAFLAALHVKKLGAFLFVTAAEPDAAWLRAWRVALYVLSAVGLWATRRSIVGLALAAVLAFHVAIHVPVLYVHRYSVDALDVWLLVAAGAGVGVLAGSMRRTVWGTFAVLGLAAVGAASVKWLGPPQPDVFAVPRLQVWAAGPMPLHFDAQAPRADLAIADTQWFRDYNHHVIVLDMAYRPAGAAAECHRIGLSFAPEGTTQFSAPYFVRAGANVQRVQVGGYFVGAQQEGTLRLVPGCRSGGDLDLRRVAIYAALGTMDYGFRLRGEPMPLPAER